ncbi:permease prefix domain 1-containing protein [Paenibacillus harenae]|uniref:permease prefix domain 1-containing protein n=1 Tax=Paenibacillus harenae TaxID=306543 RepID=UPI000418E078|nr:permease prefix domain 1-containing protein [Paenibacillus harenae]
MELVKRYIYAVTQRLPERQRADIEKELQGLIEDMLEDRVQGGAATSEDVEAVLLELGNPRELAEKYRGTKRYLISPELFTTYLSVLKIVLLSVGIAMTVTFLIETIINPVQILEHFVSNLVSLLMGCFQAFAWVTIIFGLVEYAGVKKENLGIMTSDRWKPSELAPLPDQRNRIKRSDPIAGILFTVLFLVLFTFSIDLFGVWRFQSNSPTIAPFFNEEVFSGFLPFIWAVFGLSVLKDTMKLIAGRWTIKLIGFDILVNAAHFILALIMFSNLTIWNPDFMLQLAAAGLTPEGSEAFQTVSRIWDRSTAGLIYIIGLIVAIQILILVEKAFRISRGR